MMKTVIVTGGANGIGYGIVKKYLSCKWNVVIFDVDEGACARVMKEHNGAIDCIRVDLTKDSEVVAAFKKVKDEYGSIDAVICNAGIAIRKWAVDFSMDDYDRLMNVNLRAYYLCAKIAGEIMMAQPEKGAIVCISSANSVTFHSRRSLYNTSKAAVNGMVGTLGVEWARFGVRINAVAPGYVMTDLLAKGIEDGIIDENTIMSVVPIKRYITIEEVANVVYFLTSEESSGVTGQVLFVDGGWSKNALPEGKNG